MSDNVLAVDIGGSKMAAALVDCRGTVLRRAQEPTPVTDDPFRVCDAMFIAVSRVVDDSVGAIGVGSAGPVDIEAGTVSPVNIPAGLLGAAALVLPEPALT